MLPFLFASVAKISFFLGQDSHVEGQEHRAIPNITIDPLTTRSLFVAANIEFTLLVE
jgi:hypothetical protein